MIGWRGGTMLWRLLIPVLICQLANQRVDAANPAFSTPNHVITLYEGERIQKTLVTFTCTDADPGDVTVVSRTSVTPSTPCGVCFVVYPASQCGGSNYCLQYVPVSGESLSYRTAPQYNIVVSCTDSSSNKVTTNVNVRLTANTAPRFVPNQLVATYTQPDTKNVKAGSIVFDVDTVDDQKDNILHTMSLNPASAAPFFQIGVGDGVIRAKQDLKGLCLPTVTFYVNITDGVTNSVGPLALHMTLSGANVAPDITNLDENVLLPENTAPGHVIRVITATDDAAVSKLTYSFGASPSANLAFFELAAQSIQVKSALNYEGSSAGRFTNLTVTARDEDGCTSSVHYLYVTLTDVNEAPDLRPAYAVYSVYEGPDFGTPDLSIPWNIVEEDLTDSHTYKIVGGNNLNLFTIDSSSGQLKVTTDYDIDNNLMPSSQTLTIQVTDKGGLTDNATVVLQFKDRNDNAPVISAATSTFSVCDTATPGTTLGSLTCTDKDSNFQGNNDTHFLGSGTGITVLTGGGVVLSQQPTAGQTFTAQAHCKDNGQFPGPLQSITPVYISVTGTTCTTTTTAPTQAPTAAPTTPAPATTTTTTAAAALTTLAAVGGEVSWTEDNLAWVIVAALLATALLALLAYLLYRHCRRFCCKRRKPRPRRSPVTPLTITPVEAPPVLALPAAHLYDFWKERYPDDDYGKQPNRKNNPRPMTPERQKQSPPTEEDVESPATHKKRSCCTIL